MLWRGSHWQEGIWALHKAEALFEQEGFANNARWVAQTRVQVWLAQNNLAQASTWAAQTTLSPQAWDPLRKWEVLLLARVALAEQQYARAVETLERFSWHLDQPADIEKTLEWMALYAVALHHSGKRAHAARGAARLLRLSEPEGYVRVYLDAGEPMRQVLEALLEVAGKGGPDEPQEDGNSRSGNALTEPALPSQGRKRSNLSLR